MNVLLLTALLVGGIWYGDQGDSGVQRVEAVQAMLDMEVEFRRLESPPTCKACAGSKLGELCENQEITRIQEAHKNWSEWNDVQRSQAVLKVGRLSWRHHSHGTPRVAEFLAALVEGAPPTLTQVTAAYALGLRQDPEIAVPALVRFSMAAGPAIVKLDGLHGKAVKKHGRNEKARWARVRKAKASKPSSKELKRWAKVQAETFRLGDELILLHTAHTKALVALSRYSDDRCTDALVQQASELKMTNKGKLYLGALVKNGTRPCIQVAIRGLKRWDTRHKEFVTLVKRTRKEKVPKLPKKWKGSTAQWNYQFLGEKKKRVDKVVAALDAWIIDTEGIHAVLAGFAEECGLPVPDFEPGQMHSGWRRWLLKHGSQLPSSFNSPEEPPAAGK